jgi:hypothetical protein
MSGVSYDEDDSISSDKDNSTSDTSVSEDNLTMETGPLSNVRYVIVRSNNICEYIDKKSEEKVILSEPNKIGILQ